MKKKIFALLVTSVLTVSAVSAQSWRAGAGGEWVGWALTGEGVSGSHFLTGAGGFAFAENNYFGLQAGYEGANDGWVVVGALYAGVYGQYPITLIPGLTVSPKVGVDAVINFGVGPFFGLDIAAGAALTYDFTKLIDLPVFVRLDVLFDALLLLPGDSAYSWDDYLLAGFGPRIRFAAGYKF